MNKLYVTQLCADRRIALYELQLVSAAASVHSRKLVLSADKSRLCMFYYYRERARADCHGSCATASAQCHHMLDCLFWGGAMCNQIKTTYTPSLCFLCFSAGWPAMFADFPTQKTILDNLDELEGKDRNCS